MTASIYLRSVEEGNFLCFDSNDGSDYGGSWSQFLFVDLKSGENEKVQFMSQAKRIMYKEYRAIKTCKGILYNAIFQDDLKRDGKKISTR